MRIIADVDFSPQLPRGGSYELPTADAKMLIAASLAHEDTSEPPPAAATPAPARPRSRNQYSRRDLQAQGTTAD